MKLNKKEVFRVISDALKGNPFRIKLSLVGVSDLSVLELLGLCHGVLEYFEKPEMFEKEKLAAVTRKDVPYKLRYICHWLDSLRIPVHEYTNFSQSGGSEDIGPAGLLDLHLIKISQENSNKDQNKEALYFLLYHLLLRREENATRIYLAKFLSDPQIADEFLYDPNLEIWRNKLHVLQQGFKELHRKYLEVKCSSSSSENELVKSESLTAEKNELVSKIERIKKSEDTASEEFTNLVEGAKSIRRTQNLCLGLQRKENQQHVKFNDLSQETRDIESQIHSIEVLLATGKSAKSILEHSRLTKVSLDKKLSDCIGFYEKVKRDLKKIREKLNAPRKSDNDIAFMEKQIEKVDELKCRLENKINDFTQGNNIKKSQLKLFRQQKVLTDRRIASLESVQTKETEAVLELEKEIVQERNRQDKQTANLLVGQKQSEESLLKEKNIEYKLYKQLQLDLEAELVVLSRTEHVLQGQVPGFDVEMYLNRQKQKEMYAESESLEDMSEATLRIKQREVELEFNRKKHEIEPDVMSLKDTKNIYDGLCSRHFEAKTLFSSVAKGIRSKKQRLLEEAVEIEERYASRNHSFFQLATKLQLLSLRQEQCNMCKIEDQKGLTTLELFENKYIEQQQRGSELNKQVSALSKRMEYSTKQLKYFQQMKTLLSTRLIPQGSAEVHNEIQMFDRDTEV
eukprot:augustus_masked-scaffold_25-processed-gene-5.49-mRNA-1 protein AED:1.00 eAED:1.00 QI:0/-1/0/0/-1/1/1/0/682